MARGSKPGERRGGRKKGTPNRRTAEQRQAVAEYIEHHVEARDAKLVDPVDALCELTQWAMAEFRALSQVLDEEGRAIPELLVAKAKLGMVAADWAAKAAPYIRPRLNAVEANVNVNVSVFDRIARGRQRLLAAA